MKKSALFFFLRSSCLFVLAFLALATTLPAETDEARELGVYLGQHGYGAMRVDNTMDNRQYVLAWINGKGVVLTVDTGCNRTKITEDCARHLKLDVHDLGGHDWGLGGSLKDDVGLALVSSFTLDNYEINRLNTIGVLPKSAYMRGMGDGLFGLEELRLNAVILPVGARNILFKPGNTPVPPIDHYMSLLGFKAIPLHYGPGGLRIEGQLDGQPLTAMVDCGCTVSLFDLDYVKALKESASFTGRMVRGVDGHELPAFVFTAKQLDFGPLNFKPTIVEACQTPLFKKENYHALIGYDVLASHDAIIDLGHDVLWMK